MELPDEFDAVVVGTGLVESLLAAALARSGERVLHVDKNEFYGSNFAGFNLSTANKWARTTASAEASTDAPPSTSLLETVAAQLQLPVDQLEFYDGYCVEERAKIHSFYDGAVVEAPSSTHRLGEDLADAALRAAQIELQLGSPRSYNIDLEVRLLFASGPTVDALIGLGVAAYLEFCSVRSLKCRDREVPSSKKDLFNSKSLSFTEKRKLMRMMQHGLDSLMREDAETLNERELTSSRALKRPQNKKIVAEQAAQEERQRESFFETLVEDFELPSETALLVCGALAFVSPTASPSEGWLGVHRHLRALGAHVGAATALLAPIYGSAEIPQALCRACAVSGGVYALRCPPSGFVRDKLSQRVICATFADGQIVKCDKVVIGADYHSSCRKSQSNVKSQQRTYRHVSIVESDEIEPMAIVYDNNVRCAVLGPSTNAVAEENLRLTHFSSDSLETLRDVVNQTRTARGTPLWSVEFSFPVHDDCREEEEEQEDPILRTHNLVAVKRLHSAVHFDIYHEIDQARRLYADLCNGRPLYPNPDDDDGEDEDPGSSRRQGEEQPQRQRRRVVEEDDDDLDLADLVGQLELREGEAVSEETAPDFDDSQNSV